MRARWPSSRSRPPPGWAPVVAADRRRARRLSVRPGCLCSLFILFFSPSNLFSAGVIRGRYDGRQGGRTKHLATTLSIELRLPRGFIPAAARSGSRGCSRSACGRLPGPHGRHCKSAAGLAAGLLRLAPLRLGRCGRPSCRGPCRGIQRWLWRRRSRPRRGRAFTIRALKKASR